MQVELPHSPIIFNTIDINYIYISFIYYNDECSKQHQNNNETMTHLSQLVCTLMDQFCCRYKQHAKHRCCQSRHKCYSCLRCLHAYRQSSFQKKVRQLDFGERNTETNQRISKFTFLCLFALITLSDSSQVLCHPNERVPSRQCLCPFYARHSTL